jgi:peptidoglycan/xylan/chitin deacetylase (PgdA/CDA1 family)
LDQERIAHRPDGDGTAPVVVLEGRLPAWVPDYVAAGGVLVVSGALPEERLLPAGSIASVTGFTAPDGDRRVWAPALATLFEGTGAGQLRMHEDRLVKYGRDPDVFPAVLTRRHGHGAIVASGMPLTSLLHAPGDRLRRFSRFSEVTERVASVDKADLADTLTWMLGRAFELARLPLVTLPRFPGRAQSVFIFRVDVDGVYGENMRELADSVIRHRIAASFYLNGDLSARHGGTLSGWGRGTEVGQHGQLHTILDTTAENLENLRAGEAWMHGRTGRRPASFVGPRGLWNRQLGEALACMGYRYSSDFGLDFDSLPFRADGGILQVPVHPYSPERAAVWADEQGAPAPTAADVRDHYVRIVAEQVRLGRQAHVYGHPQVLGTMAEQVLPALSSVADLHSLPRLTLAGYADFWLERERLTPRVEVLPDGSIDVSVDDIGLQPRVRAPSGSAVVVNGRRIEASLRATGPPDQ